MSSQCIRSAALCLGKIVPGDVLVNAFRYPSLRSPVPVLGTKASLLCERNNDSAFPIQPCGILHTDTQHHRSVFKRDCTMSRRHAKSFLAAAIVLIALHTVDSFDWKECPDEKSELQSVRDVTLTPEPVPVGSTAIFHINGRSST